jgi:hypothetical protein
LPKELTDHPFVNVLQLGTDGSFLLLLDSPECGLEAFLESL